MVRILGIIRRLATGRRATRTRGDEAYLFSSPRNAERLMEAQEGARKGTGQPVSLDELRSELGLAGR